MNFTRNSLALAVTLSGLAALPAAAESTLTLEEVVVTARKVEESLQDVPMSISAFSSADLESAGVNDFRDIADLTPGLLFESAIGEFLSTPTIRGPVTGRHFRG